MPAAAAATQSADHAAAVSMSASPSPSPSPSPSSTRHFSSLSSDFRLPLRVSSVATTGGGSSSSNPLGGLGTRTSHADGQSLPGAAAASQALLRRSSVAYANVNRIRLRRGSMLGREVARSSSLVASSDEDEDMDSESEDVRIQQGTDAKSPSPHESRSANTSRNTSRGPEDGRERALIHDNDDDMQIETGDVSLENVKLESHSRPNTPPPAFHAAAHVSRNTRSLQVLEHPTSSAASLVQAARRGYGKRANHSPRDRDVQRVAATLKDETRPSDSEIASEAKLQRRIGPHSDSVALATPRLLAAGTRSPSSHRRTTSVGYFGHLGPLSPSIDRTFEDEDFAFQDHFDVGNDDDDSSDGDGAGGPVSVSKMSSVASMAIAAPPASARLEDSPNVAIEDDMFKHASSASRGIAIPEATPKDALWLGFRETTPATRSSPGADRVLSRSYRAALTASTSAAPGGPSSVPDRAASMEVEMIGAGSIQQPQTSRTTMQSPSVWGRTTKRKLAEERYEPYSSSLHKRRAVSPVAMPSFAGASPGVAAASSSTGNSSASALARAQRGRSSTPTLSLSPGFGAVPSQVSPLSIQGASSGMHALPLPAPLSMPSPTLAATSHHAGTVGLSKSLPGLDNEGTRPGRAASLSILNVAGVGQACSADGANTRPSTPTPSAGTVEHLGIGVYTPGTSPMHPTPGVSVGGYGGSGNTQHGAATIATPSSTTSKGTSTKGSGPGYGSGALGLSLGSGSRRFKEEQEEQEEEEGMLGDVSAIRLGEM